jgi:hypothetical protein
MAKQRSAGGQTSRARKGAGKKSKLRTASGSRYVIVGIVTDKNTGVPLNNARVQCVGGPGNFGKKAFTNRLGLYLIANIIAERTLIEASLAGHAPVEKDKTITGHTIINFQI